jgi:LacI family transcriptional regulator
VAAAAGVSVGTVSNVLNRPDRVAPATRERVLAAIAELGFVRNESARQLRVGRSRVIGLVVLDVANPFFTDVARGAEERAEAAGLAIVLCDSAESADRETAYLELLEQQRVQGVLITPVRESDGQLEQLRARGMPVVLVDRVSRSPAQCSVWVDDVSGGDLALSHLLESGHRRVAYVGGPFSIAQVRDRRDGAARAIERYGAGADSLAVIETPALNVASGREAGERLLRIPERRRPTAVFCANDLVALGLLQEMTRQRVRVPDDVAIVGYDDIEFAAAAAVPLSSVRQPRHQLGATGAALLIEEATEPDTHRHRQVVFAPDLVVRESSRLPVVDGRRARTGTLTARGESRRRSAAG